MAEFGLSVTGLFDSIRDMEKAKIFGKDRSIYKVSTDFDAAPYATFQELGFIHHGSGEFIKNSFMRPAAKETIRELPKIKDRVNLLGEQLVGPDFEEEFLKEVMRTAMRKAKKKAPEDEGTLKETISMEKVR